MFGAGRLGLVARLGDPNVVASFLETTSALRPLMSQSWAPAQARAEALSPEFWVCIACTASRCA